MKELIREFNDMKLMPMFEIEIDGEYYIYALEANSNGIEAGGTTNVGFTSYGLICEWEEDMSLDYHLEGIYDICYESALKEHNEL